MTVKNIENCSYATVINEETVFCPFPGGCIYSKTGERICSTANMQRKLAAAKEKERIRLWGKKTELPIVPKFKRGGATYRIPWKKYHKEIFTTLYNGGNKGQLSRKIGCSWSTLADYIGKYSGEYRKPKKKRR